MGSIRTLGRTVAVVAGAAFGLLAPPAGAQDAAGFFHNRTVNLVIGYSVGGGYDLYARLLARHIGDFLPGNPTVVPQSMPGAGSLKAAIYLGNVAPKDGTTFGTFGRTIPLEPLLQGARFDPRTLSWIGSITSDVSLCVSGAQSAITTLDDLMEKPSKFGGQGAGSDPDVYASVLKKMLGAKLTLVTGYPGNNELALALERGEIDGYCGLSYSSLQATHPDWLRDHKVHLLVQAALEKSPELGNVPMLLDRVTDPKNHAALEMLLSAQTMARPYAAPPGLPADRLAALRDAFQKTIASPEFKAEANKLGLDVNPVGSDRIEELVRRLYRYPPDVVVIAKQSAGY